MFFRSKTKFVEQLNEILSLDNAVLERLQRRIQETSMQNSQRSLHQQLKEEKDQQSRLEKLIANYGGKPTGLKADLLSLNLLTNTTMDAIKKKKNSVLNETITNLKINYDGQEGDNKNNRSSMTPQEIEILNTKEDALVKKK